MPLSAEDVVISGNRTATAQATADSNETAPVSDTATVAIEQNPSIDLTKWVDRIENSDTSDGGV